MTIEHAVKIAQAGGRVAIVGDTAHRLINEAEACVRSKGVSMAVCRANGRQRINLDTGGTITFHRSPEDLRGVTLDAAYLTSIRDAPTAVPTIAPCFDTRPARIGALI